MATIPVLDESLYYRVKRVKGHECNLLCEADTVCEYITSGPFIPLRRCIRKTMMISKRDPRSKFYAKSLERMRIEENRHLERYYYMVHPFSDFHFSWMTVFSVSHVIILLVVPIYGFTDTANTEPTLVDKLAVMYCFLHIIICFFLGYYDKNTDKVILDPRQVAVHYLCSHFIFDILSTVSYRMFLIAFLGDQVAWYTRFQWGIKLNRLFTINESLDVIQLKYPMPNHIYRPLKFTLIGSILFLWITLLSYSIVYYYKQEATRFAFLDRIFLLADSVMRKITLCDIFKGPYSLIHRSELYIAACLLHCGKLFEIWLMAQIFQLFTSYMMVTHRYRTVMHQIQTYIRVKDLPKKMSRRIYKYLNFRFQYFVFNEHSLVNSLCSTLKNEILWHTCEDLITKVELFKDLPPKVMMKMVSLMKPEIYLPHDVIVNTGEIGGEMFFIFNGILAVFTDSGKEICHLAEGSHFGEIALLLNETRVASVVAIDLCLLYRLTKKDFQEAIEPYPTIKAKILKSANDRFSEIRVLSGK